MNKKIIKINENQLQRIVQKAIKTILNENEEYRYMSDDDIASQYDGMEIVGFTMEHLRNSDEGWNGGFDLIFPNADGIDFNESLYNGFIVYDEDGKKIAWERWMPHKQTIYLEDYIRQKIREKKKKNY